ncbi:DUF4185 domain-containing protein [Propionibacteriaceae bacterium Y1700]|uniref:DUF4185 domain-containing protein n=1 Tax=Microlunatus sp. Y1700 TaxID=3418487 RepID=UPI003DA6F8A3
MTSPTQLPPSGQPARPHPGMSRRHLLGGAAGIGLVGASLTGMPGVGSRAALAAPTEIDGLAVSKIANITGPDITGQFGVHWTDLGIPARCPDGRIFYAFGDTFGPGRGDDWRAPVGLWSDPTALPAAVTFTGTPGGDFAKQLIGGYRPGDNPEDNISQIIPSDVITLGDTMYMHAVANNGFGNAIWTAIWSSTDNGENWEDSGARFPIDKYNGTWQHFTWDLGDDGWVYVYSCGFLRETPMIMHRVRPEDITAPDKYESWGFDDSGWGWGKPASHITDGKYGEASLRRLGDRWVFTWFEDPPEYKIFAQIIDHPTADLRATPRTMLLRGVNWGEEHDVIDVPQLYGSYVIPGSTLSDLHLAVSQWKTSDDSIYHVMQYRFQGLDALYP